MTRTQFLSFYALFLFLCVLAKFVSESYFVKVNSLLKTNKNTVSTVSALCNTSGNFLSHLGAFTLQTRVRKYRLVCVNAATTVRILLVSYRTSLLCRRLSQQILEVSEKELELLLKSGSITKFLEVVKDFFFVSLVQFPIPGSHNTDIHCRESALIHHSRKRTFRYRGQHSALLTEYYNKKATDPPSINSLECHF